MILGMGRGAMCGITCSYQPSCKRFITSSLFSFKVFDAYTHRKGVKWSHEMGSEMMFDDLVSKNRIPLPEKDHKFIKALIAGEHARVYANLLYPYSVF